MKGIALFIEFIHALESGITRLEVAVSTRMTTITELLKAKTVE